MSDFPGFTETITETWLCLSDDAPPKCYGITFFWPEIYYWGA